MPNYLELPDELSHLLEKREGHDRRKADRAARGLRGTRRALCGVVVIRRGSYVPGPGTMKFLAHLALMRWTSSAARSDGDIRVTDARARLDGAMPATMGARR